MRIIYCQICNSLGDFLHLSRSPPCPFITFFLSYNSSFSQDANTPIKKQRKLLSADKGCLSLTKRSTYPICSLRSFLTSSTTYKEYRSRNKNKAVEKSFSVDYSNIPRNNPRPTPPLFLQPYYRKQTGSRNIPSR